MIALIVAQSTNRVIGRNNDLPWHLPADLKHFKQLTTGHTVIMGRKTFGSILERLRVPLPNRRNMVVSGALSEVPQGFEVHQSLADALEASQAHNIKEPVFIIGGATLFNDSLKQSIVDEIYLTEVKATIEGDTFFPELDRNQWIEISREDHQADQKNPYAYSFIHFRRKA